MIKAVIDTNMLVSALLTPTGAPAKILDHVLNGNVTICYDSRIIYEYQEVLQRPKFNFDKKSIKQVVDFIVYTGISIVPVPIPEEFEDQDDKMFYEVALSAGAYLVTGNAKHFPKSTIILAPLEFISIIYGGHSTI